MLLCFQESGDMFIPNSSYSPSSPIPAEQTLRQKVSDYLERERPFQPFSFEETPQNSRLKRRGGDVIYSYIKKPAKCLPMRSKIIRLQIFDIEDYKESVPCDCKAAVCAQYVAENVFSDDIYKSANDIISKMHKKM